MSAESIIKAQARNILKKNFVKAIVAMLIITLPLTMIDGATSIISLAVMNYITSDGTARILVYAVGYPVEFIMGFLLSPVINGYIRAFYRAAYTETIDLGAARYSSALSLNIRYFIRMLLPALVCYLPLIIYETIAVNINSTFHGSTVYHDFYFVIAVLSSLLITLWSIRYFTVFTVSADNPQFTPQQVFGYNKYIMQNHSGNVARLVFSFFPWMLLCLTILPMLYVIPYMTQSLCISAKWITKAAVEVN